MRLTELFVPETVVTDLPASDRDATLAAIVADLDAKGMLAAYTGGVDRLVAGFYRMRPGVDFAATDGLEVDLIFIVLGPRERRREHIRILARISRLLGNPDFRDELRRASNTSDVLNVFKRFGDR
jgi:hypothetical protein